MATSLIASFGFSGTATLSGTQTDSAPQDQVTLGSNGFPSFGGDLSDGTAADQVRQMWHDLRTVAGGANDDLDLTNLAAKLVEQSPVNFTRVELVLVVLAAPDGALQLNVGPQNVTNGWQGPFGAKANATDYQKVLDQWYLKNSKGATPGFAVSGTNKVLRVANPGGSPVQYGILILGV